LVKTISLGVKERILLAAFFPEKSSMREMRIAREIGLKVAFSPEEREDIELKTEGGQIRWKAEKGLPREIELNDDEREFLKRQITRLDSEEAYTADLLGLAERIKEL
jgi:hypothetical protein